MSEFEDKLNNILSNPDAMSQIMNLAQSIGGGNTGESAPQQEAQGGQSPPPPQSSGGGGLGALGDLLGGLDPKLISRLLPLVGELTGGGANDERMQLLYALRPFLRPERRDKVERAAKAARLIHVGKKLLTSMGENNV